LDKAQCSKGGFAVGVYPVAEVLQALILEHGPSGGPGARAQGVTPSSRRSAARSIGLVRPRRARVRAASRRAALAGDRSRYAVSRRLASSSAGMSAMSSWPRRWMMAASLESSTSSQRVARFSRALLYVVLTAIASSVVLYRKAVQSVRACQGAE